MATVVAMVIGHIFTASLAAYAELRRRSTKRELPRIIVHESRFLLVCVPQIVLLLALTKAGRTEPERLGPCGDLDQRGLAWAWGGVAARRAGLRGPGIALGGMAGFAADGAELLVQVFLQPGVTISNGVAAIPLT